MNSLHPVWIPIVGMMIPLVLVPVILGIRQSRLERELEHAERMKALELGRTLPQDESWWSPARIITAIGAGVPVGVFAFAWLASASVGYEGGVWFAATVVGTTAVFCGSGLAARHFARPSNPDKYASSDADAFDVVSRRG